MSRLDEIASRLELWGNRPSAELCLTTGDLIALVRLAQAIRKMRSNPAIWYTQEGQKDVELVDARLGVLLVSDRASANGEGSR